MKTLLGSGNELVVAAGVFVFGVCLLSVSPAVAQEAAAAKTNSASSDTSGTDYNNWLTLGAGSAFADGDKGQFQRQLQIPGAPFGGIEDFHVQQFVGKKGLFQVDGHGIFDNHDYSIRMELSDPDKGYLRAGYTEFRTWYDGSGGFFPPNNLWFSLYGDEMGLDRGQAWFEAGLTLPDKPIVTFRYEHDFRRGLKDSTSWGDATVTGVSGTSRNIVPTFRDIDETRDIFAADVKHTISKTDLGLGLRYELDRNNDSLNINRMPNNPAQNRYVTQISGLDNDLFNLHAFTETRFTDKTRLTVGGSYTAMDTDISGSRIYGSSYDAVFDPNYPNRQNRDSGFLALNGTAGMNEYVGNLNLEFTPCDNLVIVPALRLERDNTDASATMTNTAATATTMTITPASTSGGAELREAAESLEARYTGIRDVSLYARGEWTEDDGNFNYSQKTNGVLSLIDNTDWNRFVQKYIVGANWYPLNRLNFGVQYYHKIHEYDFTVNQSSGSVYDDLTEENFYTDDMNIRATWRPLAMLTLVTRYDFQLSTVDMGTADSSGQSAEMTTHIISQSVSWTPFSRLYVQASGSYVLNSLDTPAQAWMGVTNLVPNLANDYWTVNAMAGCALDEKTDLQLQYSIYRANDYVNNSAYSQPYGTGAEEQSVTATLSRQLTKAIKVSLKYGFFHNRDETSGGHNNYDAHLVFASMQYRF